MNAPLPYRVLRASSTTDRPPQPPGRVALVGAGPGSVDLLTLKAVRLIEAADWVVHDALVQPEVLALASSARLIAVGKRAGRRSTPQAEINRTLIDCALQGGLVVRLKGGDPLLFARAREELDALAQAGIPVEIVPGITTAQAAYAALGAPMTERGQRRSIVLATPQVGATGSGREERKGRELADLQWARALVNAGGGAVYMAATVADRVRATLLALGMPATTHATWIVNVSLPSQAVVATSLGTLTTVPEALAGKPALLILGAAPTHLSSSRPHALNALASNAPASTTPAPKAPASKPTTTAHA